MNFKNYKNVNCCFCYKDILIGNFDVGMIFFLPVYEFLHFTSLCSFSTSMMINILEICAFVSVSKFF